MKKKEVKKTGIRAKINKLKETTRGKAILKLIRWGIFFFCLLIFCLIASLITKNYPVHNENNLAPSKTPEMTPKDQLKEALVNINTNDYHFKYNIKVLDVNYLYNGSKTLNVVEGYKEVNGTIIKYLIDNTGTYQVVADTKTPITNLYEGLNANYLDLNFLINYITNETIECLTDNDNTVCTSSDNINNYSFTFNNTDLLNIEISDLSNTYTYNLSFTKIGSN